VLDTNVLVSGLLLPDSLPGKILQAWRSAAFTLVMSEPMLAELAQVLSYPKIRKRLKWNDQTIERFISLFRFMADVVKLAGITAEVPGDPDDAHVLSTFLAGQAECIVSGDRHLLSLSGQHPVYSPEEFWRRCGW
jgi:putative PIN family toxin of toxin-antitoxin system